MTDEEKDDQRALDPTPIQPPTGAKRLPGTFHTTEEVDRMRHESRTLIEFVRVNNNILSRLLAGGPPPLDGPETIKALLTAAAIYDLANVAAGEKGYGPDGLADLVKSAWTLQEARRQELVQQHRAEEVKKAREVLEREAGRAEEDPAIGRNVNETMAKILDAQFGLGKNEPKS